MSSKEKLPKILSHGALAAGGIAVGYLLRESKIQRVRQNMEALRIQKMRADGEAHEARQLANRDSLTGLANRRGFEAQCDKLYAALRRGNRQGDPTRASLLILDLDHFKAVNDTYGHSRGDAVLQNVAGTIVQNVREDDTVARLGGEELSVLLPNASGQDAMQVAEKIRGAIKEGGEVTVSIGVTEICRDQPEASIDYADAALYQAKENGRDQVVEISPPSITAATH